MWGWVVFSCYNIDTFHISKIVIGTFYLPTVITTPNLGVQYFIILKK